MGQIIVVKGPLPPSREGRGATLKHLLDFGLLSVLILSALMRHKLSKIAELKFTSISVLLLFYTMVRVLLSIPSVCDFDPVSRPQRIFAQCC
jgi:hypothetical protein